MKALGVLVAIQAVVSVFLTISIVSMSQKLEATTPELLSAQQSVADFGTTPHMPGKPYATPISLHEFRQVVREELQAHRRSQGEPEQKNSPEDVPTRQRTADIMDRLTSVSGRIELYKSVGTITTMQMRSLQEEIAKLDAEGRRRMLGELTKAMNSGQLDGQF